VRISAEFIVSAAGAGDFPRDGLPEIAMVGRSNVGKSSLINALTRQRVARTSAEPGKTRLANVYRVARGSAPPFYLVDLPGYGYARGGAASAKDFERLAAEYFGAARGYDGVQSGGAGLPARPARRVGALLLIDARHPGLENDRAAWQWLHRSAPAAIVGTKIDKLARGQRIRALRQLESAFEGTVLPVSAVTGEGLDELWKLIDRLVTSQLPQIALSSPSSPPGPTEPQRSTPSAGEKRPKK
jgi:GTP-binding protein